MTVVVAYLCTDGVVIATDSMITPTIGGINIGHHHGQKIHVLPGPQLHAFAGDQGQAARFRALAEANHIQIPQAANALEYALFLTQQLYQQFQATGLYSPITNSNSIGVNTILALAHGGNCHCCVFEGSMQPRMLDGQHYYVALGSGKLSADPFLRFLDDIFCKGAQPSVKEAVFHATWVVQHVIDVNPGGVAPPIHVAVFQRDNGGAFQARELGETELDEPKQAVESAGDALRIWWADFETGAGAEDVPEPPAAPPEPAAPPPAA